MKTSWNQVNLKCISWNITQAGAHCQGRAFPWKKQTRHPCSSELQHPPAVVRAWGPEALPKAEHSTAPPCPVPVCGTGLGPKPLAPISPGNPLLQCPVSGNELKSETDHQSKVDEQPTKRLQGLINVRRRAVWGRLRGAASRRTHSHTTCLPSHPFTFVL